MDEQLMYGSQPGQGGGEFGFRVPIFRMNEGVNAATASPQARQSMTPQDFAMEDFRVSPEDYQASLNEEARAGLDQGLLELNDLVSKAAMAGIDATKIDMSNPASIAVNQMFRKKFQDVKNLSKDIRTGVAQQKIELDRVARERADQAYEWQKEARDYQMNVVRPQAKKNQERQDLLDLRQDLDYEEKQVDKKFEKLISPFSTQAQSLLSIDFNAVDPKNLKAIKDRKSSLTKSLTTILENPEVEGELKDRLTSLMTRINNVTTLQAKGDGGGVGTYDLGVAQQGLFTQKANYKDSKGKESEVVGYKFTPDAKFEVYLKRPKMSLGSSFGQPIGSDAPGFLDETIVLDPQNEAQMRDINKIIQEGYSDSDEGKLAKAWLYGKVKGLSGQPSGSAANAKKGMAVGSK